MSLWLLKQACFWRFVCAAPVLALTCFLVEEYLTFGMWDAGRYQTLTGCTEEYYIFPSGTRPGTLLADTSLMARCGALPHNQSSADPNATPFCTESPVAAAPRVVTKCGQVLSILISHRYVHRPETCDQQMVPNVVHYVSLGRWEFSFLNYISFRSVDLLQKPSYIFVHGDGLPYGLWWERTMKEVANVYYVERKRPRRIQGRKVRWLEHSTDVMRLQTILGKRLTCL